jgi:DNA-directed RNA polymerase specialized sigma24 family protein
MFDQITDYSSDVEWLLQDKQAKENTILNVLVAEHFERTLRLAFLLSMDPEEATLATCETFANALLSRHRYSSDQEVQEWLDQILISTCQENLSRAGSGFAGGIAQGEITGVNGRGTDTEIERQLWQSLHALPVTDRLSYLLQSIFLIPAPSIARLLGLKEGSTDTRLETTRKQMLLGLNGRITGDRSNEEEKIAARLASSFQKMCDTELLVPRGTESMIAAIQALVEDKRREKRRRVIFQEIFLVVIVVVLVFTLVQVAVSLSADPSAGRIPPVHWIDLFSDGV